MTSGPRFDLRWYCLALALLAGCQRPSSTHPPPTPTLPDPIAVREDVKSEADDPEPVSTPEPVLAIAPVRATLGPDDLGLQLLAHRKGVQGGQVDQTSTVAWTAEPSGIVTLEPSGYIRPIGAGTVQVRANAEDGGTAVAEIQVMPSSEDRPWDFHADIVPIFTRLGCNGGGCHGKAEGQNGFHLSLFGYDPEGDYLALTREFDGRRISSMNPKASLLLRKATGQTPHQGGQRIQPNSVEYQTILAWIEAGAPERRGETHGDIVEVAVEPAKVVLEEPGPQQLRVVARFEDGHTRDVTRQATYSVHDDSAAMIDPKTGRATLLRRAETDLIVRFQTHVVSSRLATLINPDLDFDFAALPRQNLIDEELFNRLEALKVPPSPRSSDETFLRRLMLDLTGQIPRPDQIRAFSDNDDPEKRAKLVDQLMSDSLFVDFWQIKLGDLLQISQQRIGGGRGLYDNWVKRSLAENRPWDDFVRTLLTAVGNPSDSTSGGPVNYALDGADPQTQGELAAQRFLGQRFRCAQCHDHPFDIWTQDDYYGLAAFFAKVQRGGPGMGMRNANLVSINPSGQVEHLRTKQPVPPKIPGGPVVEVSSDEDPRKALADWMTSADNPYFARATVNFVWAQFFGKGIAEPADELSASNPPVHPELLDALAKDFIAHGYELRHLIRTIATSEAYGLASTTVPGNAHDTRLFSHQLPRPLTAHQMADALAQATDTPNRFDLSRGGGGALVTRKAVQVSDPSIPSVLLDTFGRCPRTAGCSTVATPTLSLRQSLMLIGGNVIDDRITRFDGYLSSLLEFDPEPEEIVENLYLRTLCRKPTDEESSHWSAELKASSNVREVAEDLFWALLNSREFAFNH